MRLDSLLARLTLLIAHRKGEEARDDVRPRGEKEVKVLSNLSASYAEGAKSNG